MNFREYVKKLDNEGKLVRINEPLSIKYEIPAIIKKLDGIPLLFENVKDYDISVASNIYSSKDLVAEGIGCSKDELIIKVSDAINNPKKINISKEIKYQEFELDLSKLPILTHYEKDGGPYISSAVVVSDDKEFGMNASYHRMMIIDKDKFAVRILPRHLDEFIKRGNREVAICIGNSAQVAFASAISAELGKSELEIANSLVDTYFSDVDGHIVPDSEIIMIADILDKEHDEGPFVDLTGTYDIIRKQRIFEVKKIYAKKDVIYQALLPGGLEHKMLMGIPKEPAIYNEVNKVCKCNNVNITSGGCSWLHAVVQIDKKDKDDGKKAIEAAFNGHKSLKHVVIVDGDIDIHNPNDVEWAIATRFQGDKNLVVKEKQKGSSLDPSSDMKTRETTKIGMDATIPSDKNKEDFKKHKIPGEDKINVKKYLGE